jgi:hypothetical protein
VVIEKGLSNEEKISSTFRRVYFDLSFSFKSPIYVDIMRVFKVETKDEQTSFVNRKADGMQAVQMGKLLFRRY